MNMYYPLIMLLTVNKLILTLTYKIYRQRDLLTGNNVFFTVNSIYICKQIYFKNGVQNHTKEMRVYAFLD